MTELWVEPQDGVVANTTNTQWTEMIGQKFSDAQRVILEQDRDIISTLSTYEHLQIICKNPIPMLSPQELNDGLGNNLSNYQLPNSNCTVGLIPYHFNVKSLLEKSQQLEILLSMFIQDFSGNPPEGFEWCQGLTDTSQEDRTNELLFEQIKELARQMHDKEIQLSENQNVELFNHFVKQKEIGGCKVRFSSKAVQQSSPPHLPMAAASVAAQTAGSSGSSHPLKRQSVVSRISSRLTSATNSGEQQRGDLSFDHVSGSQASSRAATGYQGGRRGQRCSYPKWTCFAKTGSVLSNHLLVTFMPSSYQDLKQLILDDHALSGKEGAALKVIKTPIVQSSESEPSVVKPGMATNSILFC